MSAEIKLGDKVRIGEVSGTVQVIIGPVGREFVRVIGDGDDDYWWVPIERVKSVEIERRTTCPT